jgi:electron transport complex protein RnfC
MKGFAILRNGGLQLRNLSTETGGIRNAVIPSIAVFPLLQHSGSPAECIVSVGDRVREGMMIARSSGPLSVPIHSSIPGVVTGRRPVRLPNGEYSDAVVIKLEGEFARLSGVPAYSVGESSREELLDRMEERGLVTLDSDAVPLHALWKLPRGKHIDRLIVSTLNDEPYLSVESQLAVEHKEVLVEGFALALRVLRPRKIVYVSEKEPIDGEKSEIAETLDRAAAAEGIPFEAATVGSRYPRGERRELVRVVTGRRVPPGASILDLGVLVTNASTLVALREAVLGGKPLIERYVSVRGGAVSMPTTLRVRIGTRVQDLLEECGGFSELPDRIIVGGPLSGAVIYDLDTPVMKNTSAILALTHREVNGGSRMPCINCGRCLTSCPEGLNAIGMYQSIERGRFDRTIAAKLSECTECGCCGVVCPSHIPLLHGLRLGKRMVRRGDTDK